VALLLDDPVDVLLDADGDIDFSRGGMSLSTGLTAVVQGIGINLAMMRGEWFLDLDAGVPWLANDVVPEAEAILGARPNEARMRFEVRDAILRTPGVLAVTALLVDFDGDTRAMTVDWRASTVFGDTAGVSEVG
jgi:hypothetical protein